MIAKPINPGKYMRRRVFSGVMEGLCGLAAAFGLIALALILATLVQRGIAGLTPTLFTETMKSPGQHGGLANAIVGTLIQTGLGALIGAPIGIAVGVYLSEVGRGGPFASVVRFVNDMLLSAPSVLIGLFVFQLIVLPVGHFSGIAGAVALALIAIPVVARTTEDIIKLLPQAYRDGSVALGARESATVLRVVLPAAFGGILTGVLLAVARISGETAPLIFTSLGDNNFSVDLTRPMASLPLAIYHYAQSPFKEQTDLAWAGALVITVGVLALNVASRSAHRFLAKR